MIQYQIVGKGRRCSVQLLQWSIGRSFIKSTTLTQGVSDLPDNEQPVLVVPDGRGRLFGSGIQEHPDVELAVLVAMCKGHLPLTFLIIQMIEQYHRFIYPDPIIYSSHSLNNILP